jgi:hypothetical protein
MMRLRTISLITVFVIAAVHSSDGNVFAGRIRSEAVGSPGRIKFQIVTVEERGTERNILSESTIEGPPNTDFNINLDGDRFRMSARFLIDLIPPDKLRIRTKLDTRRLYGVSERDLPLYEEDEQKQSLELTFDEGVVLLPFGRSGGDHRLKIEVTPALSSQTSTTPSGEIRPLEINVLKPSPGGIVRFEAFKNPHNFVGELVLLEDGREIARSVAALLIEEPQEITLQPSTNNPQFGISNPLKVKLNIERYSRSRPADQVTFGFDIFEHNSGRNHLGLNGAGVASLGSSLSYDLTDQSVVSAGKKYELRLKFSLAPGEQAN